MQTGQGAVTGFHGGRGLVVGDNFDARRFAFEFGVPFGWFCKNIAVDIDVRYLYKGHGRQGIGGTIVFFGWSGLPYALLRHRM